MNKLVIGYTMQTIEITFKPWKNRPSSVIVIYNSFETVDLFVQNCVINWKKIGKYKQRTITGYKVNLNIKL